MHRFFHRILLAAACVAALAGTAVAQSQPFALKDGDRVVFYGDSITAQRMYTRLVEAMVVTRYPHMHVDFYSAGVSGDTVYGGKNGTVQERVPRDVAPFHPTVVTVALGTNDGHYTLDGADANFLTYQKGYRTLIDLLKQSAASGARFTLAAPVAYDEISRPAPVTGYNNVMIRYGGFVKQLATENHFLFADLNRPMTELLTAESQANSTAAHAIYADHVHPEIWGHWVMAASIVRAWGFDPLVSSVVLDGVSAKVVSTQKAEVSAVTKTATGLQWSQLDQSLPLPLVLGDVLTQAMIHASSIESLDQQTLQVNGLTAPRYGLWIDGKRIIEFTQQQLSTGINLALLPTPMEDQARSVDWDGSERRAKLSATRLNLMAQMPPITDREIAAKALDALDAQMVQLEYTHAQPVVHHFELKEAGHAF